VFLADPQPAIERISALIQLIHKDLEGIKNDYCIIGSGALLLSGVNVSVHDLDILTSKRSAEKLISTWNSLKDLSYQPNESDRFRSTFGRFQFDLPVEVMGDLEVNQFGNWVRIEAKEVQHISISGNAINIPSLADQVRIFRSLGREKDLNKIKLIKNL